MERAVACLMAWGLILAGAWWLWGGRGVAIVVLVMGVALLSSAYTMKE